VVNQAHLADGRPCLSVGQFLSGSLAAFLLIAELGCGQSLTVHASADGAVEARPIDLVQVDPTLGSVEVRSIATTTTGNIALAGLLQGSVDLGNGPLSSAGGTDLLVADFDPSGATIWSRRFGDATDQGSAYVATSGTGDIVVATGFRGVLDFGAALL
jgi:hypothetical protein